MPEPEHPSGERGAPAAAQAPASRGPDWLSLAMLLLALLNLTIWFHNRSRDVAPPTLTPSPAGPEEEAPAQDSSDSGTQSSHVRPPGPPTARPPVAAPSQPVASPLPLTIGEPLLSEEIGEYVAALSFLTEHGVDVKPIQEADSRALKSRMDGDLQGERTHNLAALAAAQRLLLELFSEAQLQGRAGDRDRSDELKELVAAGKLSEAILLFKEIGPKSLPRRRSPGA